MYTIGLVCIYELYCGWFHVTFLLLPKSKLYIYLILGRDENLEKETKVANWLSPRIAFFVLRLLPTPRDFPTQDDISNGWIYVYINPLLFP